MSEPFTREKCGICGKQFEIPMEKSRRAGWCPTSATFSVIYCDDEEFTEEYVCLNCSEAIKKAVDETVEMLKKARGVK